MFKYNLLNKPTFEVCTKVLDSIFSEVNNIVGKKQNGTLNIVLVGEEDIKKLNREYRNIDKATDVLSFHYYDAFGDLDIEEIAGEIVMCESLIISQGNEFKLGPEKEFYKLLIHSVLHILGYDHEIETDYEVMKELEDRIGEII